MNKLIMVCVLCVALIYGQSTTTEKEYINTGYNVLPCECEAEGYAESGMGTEETNKESPKKIVLKDVKLTAYCKEPYAHICNDGDASNTATMTVPTVGRTVAVDPKVIPYGSKVTILYNGKAYIAEDTGSAIKGNRVDILFETHQEALEFGIQYSDVVVEV